MNFKKSKLTMLFLGCFCIANKAQASSPIPLQNETQTDKVYETAEENVIPVVITATKTPKKLENVPAVVTLVTEKEIETMPTKTLSDLLADLPGVYAYEPQGVGVVTPPSLSISGNAFSGAAMVLLDGQRINTPFTDYAYLTTIPARAVERIEFIRGPFSALYGSSAGGGIVNIITKDGITKDGKGKSYVSPWAEFGNFGGRDYGISTGIVGNSYSLGLFYDHKQVDNYFMYDDIEPTTDKRIYENREYKHERFHGKLTGTIGENTEYSLSAGFIDAVTNYGIGLQLQRPGSLKLKQNYINFQTSNKLSEKLTLKTQLDWLQAKHLSIGETLERVVPGKPPIRIYKPSFNNTKSNRYRLDVSANYYFDPKNILTFGSEVVHTTGFKGVYNAIDGTILNVYGKTGQAVNVSDTLYSVYGQYNKIFNNNIELLLGARYDNYKSFGSSFSPKASLIWHYKDNGNLKLSVGKGFHAPNLSDLYSPPWALGARTLRYGNPDLKAETLWTYQLSLEQRALNNKLLFRVTPYYTDATNLITSIDIPNPDVPGTSISTPQNINKVKIKGADFEIGYNPIKNIKLFTNYTYNETRDAITKKILHGYPKHAASLGIRSYYDLNHDIKFVGSYSARYRGKATYSTRGLNPEIIPGYWNHTAKIGLDWRDKIQLNAEFFNIGNYRGKVRVDTYLPQANYRIGLSVKHMF